MSRRRGQPVVPLPASRRDSDPAAYRYPEPEGCHITAMPIPASARGISLWAHFAPTDDEAARLKRGFSNSHITPEGWRTFAAKIYEYILAGYAAGQTDLRRTLDMMRSCALGCTAEDRIVLLALGVERALRMPPPEHVHTKRHPQWLRDSAATLVAMLRDDRPGEAWAPNEMNGWTTPILMSAIAQLAALGLIADDAPVTARTVYGWCRDADDGRD